MYVSLALYSLGTMEDLKRELKVVRWLRPKQLLEFRKISKENWRYPWACSTFTNLPSLRGRSQKRIEGWTSQQCPLQQGQSYHLRRSQKRIEGHQPQPKVHHASQCTQRRSQKRIEGWYIRVHEAYLSGVARKISKENWRIKGIRLTVNELKFKEDLKGELKGIYSLIFSGCCQIGKISKENWRSRFMSWLITFCFCLRRSQRRIEGIVLWLGLGCLLH